MSIAVSRRKNRVYSVRSRSEPERVISGFKGVVGFVGLGLKIIVALVIIAGLSILILFGYREITTSSFFDLEKVRVQGNEQLQYSTVVDIAGISLGDNLLDLNISKIKSRLENNPWVTSVIVSRELPARLSLNLKEKRAWFWVRRQGRLYYADKNGQKIAPVHTRNFISLPLLAEVGETELDLEKMVSLFKGGEMPFSLQQVAWVRATGRRSVLFGFRDRDLRVEMDASAWRKSVNRLSRVWNDLQARGELVAARYLCSAEGLVWVKYKERTG